MSRRRDRARRAGAPPSAPREARAAGENAPDAAGRLPVQIGLLVAAFAVAVGVAELAGAANLGVAAGVGQVVFVLVLIVLLIRA